jgi:hypothetical protein
MVAAVAKSAAQRLRPASQATPGDKSSTEMMTLRQQCDDRLVGLRSDRYSWWVHWRELADYILPRRYKWLITPNQANRGSPINQRIIDSTGTIAARVLAAGMMAGITSPGRPWFRLTLSDKRLSDNQEVKQWLSVVRDLMLEVFAESNFYNALATMYQDLAVFGTAPMIMYEDFEDVIRCYNPCAGEYYLSNGPRGNVDTLYREYVKTVLQVAEEFGLENCSPTVQSAIATGGAQLSQEIVIAHAIEPNSPLIAGLPQLKGYKYREIYWEYGSGQNYILRVKGFHECPFNAPRWDTVGNDAYGRSPGMDALGDVKQLQVQQKRKAQAIDKMVNPPMIADVALKNEPASLLPGGVTYVPSVASGVGFKPVYEVKPELQYMTEDMREVQGRVRTTFFYDLFLMISQLDTVRTATEIDARREEKLIQLGPVLERFEGEALDPAIGRTFNIMHRAGMLPPIPDVLRGQNIQAEYVSMLAQAQRAAMTAGMERFAAFVGNIGAVKPDAYDNVDTDEMIDIYADRLGVDPKIVVPFAKVQKIREERARQQAEQQMQVQAAQAVAGAKVLSETDVGGGQNALQRMIG